MKAGWICRRRVITIGRGESPARAAELMRDHHVGALVVTTDTTDGPHVVGVVTDRDLVIEALARGPAGASAPVGELANLQVASVCEEDDLERAVALMQDRGVRRLLVTDADKRLVGFVSLDDLIDAYAGELAGLVKVIRSGIERETQATQAMASPAAVVLRLPPVGATAGPA